MCTTAGISCNGSCCSKTVQIQLFVSCLSREDSVKQLVQLQGKTSQLEQIVRQKELEIERLQHQLESKKSSGSSDSSGDVCNNLELGEDTTEACASQVRWRNCRTSQHLVKAVLFNKPTMVLMA